MDYNYCYVSKKKAQNNRLLIVFLSLLFPWHVGLAEELNNVDLLKEYKKLLAEQQKEFQIQRKIIADQGQELQQMKARLDALSNQAPSNKQAAENPKKPVVTAATSQRSAPPPNQLPDKPVGKDPTEKKGMERPPEIPRLSETVGGVLTRKGKIAIEPSLQYGYSDNYRVFLDAYTFIPAIAIGLIDIRQIKRHTMMASLAARYGITDRWEFELRMPYVYRSDSQRSRPVDISAATDETFNASGSSIGDLEIATRYQLTSGANGWPILVGNVLTTVPTGKSPFDIEYVNAQGVPGATYPSELPTGVGYFSFQPSITALYPTDPAVFFGNISYNYNTETKQDFGTFDPGDTIGFSFGLGFGINDRTSFSLGYSHRHVFTSAVNGIDINGSELDIGQFLVGYSYKYSPQTTFNLSLGIGTTDDAQGMNLNFRMPMTFDFISVDL
jgi:hypothetical protein